MFSSGSIDARAIVGVHRAIKEDPFHKGLLGTRDLRTSRSQYVSARCFSLILASPKFPWSHTHSPAGTAAPVNVSRHNKSFDLEAQNEGEVSGTKAQSTEIRRRDIRDELRTFRRS